MATRSQPNKKPGDKKPPSDPIKEGLKGKLKAKVDRLDTVTDVLTGREIPEGKLGEKIKALKELDTNPDGIAKVRRDKKFKRFDEWLAREQKLNNIRDEAGDEVPYVRLRRSVRVQQNEKGQRKVI